MTGALLSLVLAMPCRPSVSFDSLNRTHRIQVDLATTAEAREKGLMFVKHLPLDRGMWFIFPNAKMRRFWMKNTLIPLDIIFVDEALQVINVIHAAEPGSTQARRSIRPARFVLELAGGQAQARSLRPGTQLTTCGIEARGLR